MDNTPTKAALQATLNEMMDNLATGHRSSDSYEALMLDPSWAQGSPNNYSNTAQTARFIREQAFIDINGLENHKNRFHYAFAFLHHDFLTAHIAALCAHLEGSACSEDKAKEIADQYRQHLLDAKLPNWHPHAPNCYWLPRVGSQAQWFAFAHSLAYLFNGDASRYFLAYNELAILKEKSKHEEKGIAAPVKSQESRSTAWDLLDLAPFRPRSQPIGAPLSFAELCLRADMTLCVHDPHLPTVYLHQGDVHYAVTIEGTTHYCIGERALPSELAALDKTHYGIRARFMMCLLAYGAGDYAAKEVVLRDRRLNSDRDAERHLLFTSKRDN